jgi:hypothetical protein
VDPYVYLGKPYTPDQLRVPIENALAENERARGSFIFWVSSIERIQRQLRYAPPRDR